MQPILDNVCKNWTKSKADCQFFYTFVLITNLELTDYEKEKESCDHQR